jgi:hypothetical protein
MFRRCDDRYTWAAAVVTAIGVLSGCTRGNDAAAHTIAAATEGAADRVPKVILFFTSRLLQQNCIQSLSRNSGNASISSRNSGISMKSIMSSCFHEG